MVPKKKIDEILDGYDPSEITIATLCSHSSLQIFHGARKMGFKTLGLVTKNNQRIYDAFPLAKPDKFISYSDYDDMSERAGELQDANAIIIPHGSFVEYMGAKAFEDFEVPSYGNRGVLSWESDRVLQRQWITSAGAPMPRLITDAREIKEPVMVKYHGAKGGRGFFIAKDYPDFKMGIDNTQPYTYDDIQLESFVNRWAAKSISGMDIRITIARLAAILRVANSADRSHCQKLRNAHVSVRGGKLIITTDYPGNLMLEKISVGQKAEFFGEIYGLTPVLRQRAARR